MERLFAWLQGGAHLYVCGDAERMAPDVHAALIEIVATQGGRSAEDSAAYLAELRANYDPIRAQHAAKTAQSPPVTRAAMMPRDRCNWRLR